MLAAPGASTDVQTRPEARESAPAADRAADTAADGLSILNLVTTQSATFYRQQVETLAGLGAEVATLPVPGDHRDRRVSRTPADYLRLARAVRRADLDRYDLVHANYGLTAPAALAQRDLPALAQRDLLAPLGRPGRAGPGDRGGLPVVVSLWGSDLLGRYGPLARWCARRADAVVVMTEAMRRELGRDCHVIPHGVDLDQFRPMDRRDACASLDWDPDAKHVFFPYPKERKVKNYHVAERVVETARRRVDPAVHLHVGGGQVPHDEMPAYMNAADALLLPSEREGSPNTVKEAMACNLPVVATPVGDVPLRLAGVEPSPVRESESALVDGLVRVLRSGERSNGRDAVRGLGLDRMGERLVGVYRDVLEGE